VGKRDYEVGATLYFALKKVQISVGNRIGIIRVADHDSSHIRRTSSRSLPGR